MAINKGLKKSGYYAGATTNGSKVVRNLTIWFKNLTDYTEELVGEMANIFVQLARERLINSGYNVNHLADNIYAVKSGNNKWRIAFKNNNEKPIMYFLEFGTGLVGKKEPHPNASKVGWRYVINPNNIVPSNGQRYNSFVTPSGYNSLGEYVGYEGWYYYDENNDLCFTSGLKAVAYIYDTVEQDLKTGRIRDMALNNLWNKRQELRRMRNG